MKSEELIKGSSFNFQGEFDIHVIACFLDHVELWGCTLLKDNTHGAYVLISDNEPLKNTIDLWKAIKKEIIKNYSFLIPILEEGK